MWINRVPCCLLAVVHLCILNELAHSQETDLSHKPQSLTCITHNFETVICSWTTASTANLGFNYLFCPRTPSAPACSETKEKTAQINQLISFASIPIEISTLHPSGKVIAKNTFLLTDKNISFVPPTPLIHTLTANFLTDTLNLEWYDGGSAFTIEMDATWQIQILRKNTMEEVALEFYPSKLTGENTLLHWSWKSDLPFQCTTHYVRIRCFLHEEAFPGNNMWSEWSQLANIPGNDTGSSTGVFPVDRVVLVGSNVTFCCVWKEGESILSLKYSDLDLNHTRFSDWSAIIQVQNVSAEKSGKNAFCTLNTSASTSAMEGAVLFPGYPPDVPQNVSCETWNLKEMTCEWKRGRSTKLYGTERGTKYLIFERISGGNVTFDSTKTEEHFRCNFAVLKNHTTYNFTVQASNPLGRSAASLSIDIKRRVHPQPPSRLTVRDKSPNNVTLSWYLPGSFMDFKLQCQVKVTHNTFREELNMWLEGAEDSRYTISVDKLHPYTAYTFQVRCSAAEPLFWKWSNWSEGAQHRTQQAPPSAKLDIWRERSPDGETINIFWKPLPISDRNGLIEKYEVSWCLSETSMNRQAVLEPFNSTTINLGGNDCVLLVVAKNKGGHSPPSLINTAEIPVFDVPTENAVSTGDGIYITWHPDFNVTCGYTVRWCHGPEPCAAVNWETFPKNVTNAVIKSALFQPGVRYIFSLYGCKDNGYELLSYVHGYTQELDPVVPPVFIVEDATSDSILIRWKDISVENSRGFLKGYLLRFSKGEKGSMKPKAFESGQSETYFNITDLKRNTLKISNLQGKTSYHLNLRAYTAGGMGPAMDKFVVTKDNSVGLIIAIIVPVAIVIVLGVVTSMLCYRKREWIKETFYPDIPNPENCKALEFPKDPEGNPNSKTLEMNPCTPNNIEVVETQTPCLKIEDTAITSPVAEELPEDGFDLETESHIVVSYCPPIIEEEISNPPIDEPVGSSQVVYIDIQTMYPAPVKPKEELEVDCVAAAGYKPQMQLPVNRLINMEDSSSVEEDMDKAAGYRPQVNTPSWNTGCPDSPRSIESNNENTSFGSPCSVNSRQFLIPPKEDEDSPKAINTGWSFANFFHNKPHV
ncbi:leukemia inhibitory factor receptor [Rhineura floridana]|uniref:leukemia inhibitory factor receptor n=1 Tax=Rhineura floridana TaxID=261503 RepID=UPI002AC81E96|nr:leukemia inhibitory factor receptor [Rhineura floridana]XP_061472695.1 leukemia inhibitory factor receptor [Rhineura floridana]XP_061472704.1 leukemia inhibitory factor receptor [Rhineura floridana]XP_061472713.1 leukemia inhibitory factor receptor [Rhineura floridana]